MTDKEFIIAVLGKTLNLPADQIAPLVYIQGDDGAETISESALQNVLAKDAERVAKLKPNTKEFFDNGYKAAEAKLQSQHEKALRELVGIDPEGKLKGDELHTAVKAAMAEGSTKRPEDVKNSRDYLELEASIKRREKELQAQYEQQLTELKSGMERDRTWSEVRGEIAKAVRAMPNINQEVITEPMLDLFASQFRGYDYERTDGGFIPIKDGKRVENGQGYARPLSELVAEQASVVLPTRAQPAAGNAGNKNQGGGNSVNVKFKDENDFLKQYNDATDDQKVALEVAWEAQEQSA